MIGHLKIYKQLDNESSAMDYNFYIRYSWRDKQRVTQIIRPLVNAGYSLSFGPGVEKGAKAYSIESEKAIQNSTIVIFFLSSNAKTLKWLERDISFATQERKAIITVFFDNSDSDNSVTHQLNTNHIIRYDNNQPSSAIEKLRYLVTKYIGNRKPLDVESLTFNESPEYLFNFGRAYYEIEDYDKAVKCYRSAAENKFAPALHSLGYCYMTGLGVEKSYEKAEKWMLMAAEQGYDSAQFELGFHYISGIRLKKAPKEGVNWLLKAALQNHVTAQLLLAECYSTGKGCSKNVFKAIKWFLAAANQNDPIAQYKIGKLYSEGRGLKRDYQQAAKWYLKSAKNGHAKSQSLIGFFYENGIGVPQDYQQALKWYQKAAEQGDKKVI